MKKNLLKLINGRWTIVPGIVADICLLRMNLLSRKPILIVSEYRHLLPSSPIPCLLARNRQPVMVCQLARTQIQTQRLG